MILPDLSMHAAPAGMTAANWRAHPFAPWAFNNVSKFLSTDIVRKGADEHALVMSETLGPISFDDGAGGQTTLPEFLRATHADGLMVLHRGMIVFDHYGPHTDVTTRHLSFSITKSIVGLLAEQLIAEQVIDPAALAGQLVPELAGTAFGDAALRDLLDMRDGVVFDENYADPNAQIHLYSRHFWGAGEGGVLAALRQLPTGHKAQDAAFCYRTPVTDVIGLMIERSTGTTLPVLVGARLWQKARAAEDAHWVLDTGGRAIASAGFTCTLRDLARFGLLIVDSAKECADSSLRSGITAIQRGGDRAAFSASGQETRPGYSYRSGWWIDHEANALNALGVFGQRLHIVPEAELIIARFGSHPVASNQSTDAAHALAFSAIRAALSDGR